MKKYRVSISISRTGYYEVEARSEQEAEEKAAELYETEEVPSYRIVEGDMTICDINAID